MYEIRYLPLAVKDLEEIVSYITNELKSPKAAMDLIDEMDSSISRLKKFPYSCRVYYQEREFENEYRVLPVKNYLIFYVVKENIVEVHRILYSKMDVTCIIK
ncbi:type II toxin-antitoxin system RelE/ParE family toxin [Thermobrachium celere]|uniref:Death on curing protein, Doc toxin n=1 Tax=Thermobrachium celere DSM 8682 TaxID=941824 RepID=R7RRA8_9CLOT|nr:type II toxin-antitoxin system RelE/ParE family toxin [Thermobrachium celere]CDF58737.1 hypothetical protein TCEL_00956 [Thermobrachium celere DSM 8682]